MTEASDDWFAPIVGPASTWDTTFRVLLSADALGL